MKCCRECKALNPQDALICSYCRESLPIVASLSSTLSAKFNLSSLLKRRLVYLAVVLIILLLVALVRG
jgi:hypothetical protein